ncbi:MAG: hypothetical protein WCK37_05115 [Candidatus Falkowbacteria bacterium]
MDANELINFLQSNQTLNAILLVSSDEFIEPEAEMSVCEHEIRPMNKLEKTVYTLYAKREEELKEFILDCLKKYGDSLTSEELLDLLEEDGDDEILSEIKRIGSEKDYYESLLNILLSTDEGFAHVDDIDIRKGYKIVRIDENCNCETCPCITCVEKIAAN